MRRNLLLVDDDQGLHEVLSHQLRQMGYRVQTANTGQEALTRFRTAPADIVVTDAMMPDMHGLTLLRRIKAVAPETIVVIITAYGDVEDAIKACELGAYDYLMKPFSKEQLRFALAKAEHIRHPERENISLRSELAD